MFHRIPALVTLPLLGTILTILIGSPFFTAPEPADPLALYAALTPGQPVAVLKQYPCNYPYIDEYDGAIYCQIKPDGGPIRLISITTRDGRIFTVSFMGDGLRVGDLVQQWGRPDEVSKGKASFRAKWHQGIVATGRSDFWFNYQTVVRYVALYKAHPARTVQASNPPADGVAQQVNVGNQAG